MFDDSIAIFLATHVKFDPPNNPIYIPMHVGKKGKPDLGYIGDDIGDNISDLNPFYSELTGLYWIWRNIQDITYVGLCHYRRWFINDNRIAMNKQEYLGILKNNDAIVPKHAECPMDYRSYFGKAHNVKDLDAIGEAIKKLYPDYFESYEKAMGGYVFYGGNLFVTSLKILKAYSEWLFNIFALAGENIDVSSYDDYHKRIYGFLSEQLFYVYALNNDLKLHEQMVGISSEKAETMELKEELLELLKEGKKEEAREVFQNKISLRPDLLLPGSDIHNELKSLYERLL